MTIDSTFWNDQIDAARPLISRQLWDAYERFVAEMDTKQFAPSANLCASTASEVCWVEINTKFVVAVGFDVIFYNFVSGLGFIYWSTHACTYRKESTAVVCWWRTKDFLPAISFYVGPTVPAVTIKFGNCEQGVAGFLMKAGVMVVLSAFTTWLVVCLVLLHYLVVRSVL